jgi:hypothetical protein
MNLSHSRQLQRLPEAERHEASKFTLAVVMAGIAAFFIAGIASAFIYAKDPNPARTAETSKPPLTAPRPSETTGFGGTADAK